MSSVCSFNAFKYYQLTPKTCETKKVVRRHSLNSVPERRVDKTYICWQEIHNIERETRVVLNELECGLLC